MECTFILYANYANMHSLSLFRMNFWKENNIFTPNGSRATSPNVTYVAVKLNWLVKALVFAVNQHDGKDSGVTFVQARPSYIMNGSILYKFLNCSLF